MKKLAFLMGLGLLTPYMAMGADITLYYSPTCPHCHHARAFIADRLVYEYPTISVTAVNVMNGDNLPLFQDALEKCDYSSGGVPVIVIGDKCFQGYANFMQDDIRNAVEMGMNDDQKSVASNNKSALDDDADAFRAKNTARANVIREHDATANVEKKSEFSHKLIFFYGLLIVLVLGLGVVVFGRRHKK